MKTQQEIDDTKRNWEKDRKINEMFNSAAFSSMSHGMTKRELIAAMCLQGLLANPNFNGDTEEAVNYADTLLMYLLKYPMP